MKATISRDNLFDLLSAVEQYDKNTVLDILKFALLKAEGDKISISATNLETETTIIVPAAIEDEGQILVPIRRIYDLCRSLPDVNIKLTISKNYRLKLDWGNTATIAIRDVEDFPYIIDFNENDNNIISVSTESLKEVLPQVTFAAATDESRPILAGVHLTENMLQSTDGFRASFIKFDTLGDVVISATALNGFCKLLCGEEVKIQKSGNKIVFKLENETIFTSNSIEGDFPDIKQLYNPEADLKLTFNTKHLLSVLRQAETFDDNNHFGFSEISASKSGFDIKTQSENDEFEASVPVVKAEGESEITFGISLAYLSSNRQGVLPRITSEFVEIHLRGNGNEPVTLKSGDLTHIIMPMEIRKRG